MKKWQMNLVTVLLLLAGAVLIALCLRDTRPYSAVFFGGAVVSVLAWRMYRNELLKDRYVSLGKPKETYSCVPLGLDFTYEANLFEKGVVFCNKKKIERILFRSIYRAYTNGDMLTLQFFKGNTRSFIFRSSVASRIFADFINKKNLTAK
jgi:hypothetical protein